MLLERWSKPSGWLFKTLLLLALFPISVPPVQAEQDGKAIASGDLEPATIFRDCGTCPEMVVIPGGSFLMGSPPGETGRYDDEGPEREVSVPQLALGRYEVTRQEFAQFVSSTGHETGPCVYWEAITEGNPYSRDLDLGNPRHRQRPTGQHPVTCVSWHDAKAYAEWLRDQTGKAYRLPSEAEWEYAARAETRSRYFWGDGVDLACGYANGHDETSRRTNDFNWPSLACSDGHGLTAPAGSFDANPFSLFDMAGNLWEWVEDHYHDSYEGAPIDGGPWLSPKRSARVLRGGSFEDEPRDLRSARRIWSRPESRLNSSGFRVALTLPAEPE